MISKINCSSGIVRPHDEIRTRCGYYPVSHFPVVSKSAIRESYNCIVTLHADTYIGTGSIQGGHCLDQRTILAYSWRSAHTGREGGGGLAETMAACLCVSFSPARGLMTRRFLHWFVRESSLLGVDKKADRKQGKKKETAAQKKAL